MLEKVLPKLSRLYLIISSIWLLFSQMVFVLTLWWPREGEQPELFGSPVLYRMLSHVLDIVGYGFIAAVVAGVLLLVVIAIKRIHADRSDLFNIGSGLFCMALILISAAILEGWNEYYGPPPGLPQFIRVGIIIVLDVVLGVTVWQLMRRYQVRN